MRQSKLRQLQFLSAAKQCTHRNANKLFSTPRFGTALEAWKAYRDYRLKAEWWFFGGKSPPDELMGLRVVCAPEHTFKLRKGIRLNH
jgi:hypothetical protein